MMPCALPISTLGILLRAGMDRRVQGAQLNPHSPRLPYQRVVLTGCGMAVKTTESSEIVALDNEALIAKRQAQPVAADPRAERIQTHRPRAIAEKAQIEIAQPENRNAT